LEDQGEKEGAKKALILNKKEVNIAREHVFGAGDFFREDRG